MSNQWQYRSNHLDYFDRIDDTLVLEGFLNFFFCDSVSLKLLRQVKEICHNHRLCCRRWQKGLFVCRLLLSKRNAFLPSFWKLLDSCDYLVHPQTHFMVEKRDFSEVIYWDDLLKHWNGWNRWLDNIS